MIVVETSAIVAILRSEPNAEKLVIALASADRRACCATCYVEAGVVAAGRERRPLDGVAALDAFLKYFSIDIVPIDADLARLALDARIRFGKGFGHPAQLNFGDSFSYALAKKLNAPLLFVGADFALTDVAPALR